MSSFLCDNCDDDILEMIKNDDNIYNYLNIIQKRINNNVLKKIVTDNIYSCDDVNKILNNYIEIHNKKYNIFFVKCEFSILFDNDDNTYLLETTYEHYLEVYKIDIQLKFFIDMLKEENKNIFKKINQMTIIIINDICNMTNYYAKYMRFNSIERRINQISGKNPDLLNNISNNILIKNKSHIIFNI